MGACSCLSREGAGRPGAGSSRTTAWKAGKCTGNVRASGVPAAGEEGKPCLGSPGWLCRAVSEKPEVRWLQDESWSLAQCREPRGRHGCSAAAYKRAWAGGFPAGRAGKGCTGMRRTGRGWLISFTPSSQARLGGGAWDSLPCPGAEKLPPAPETGLLCSPPAWLPHSAGPRQTEPRPGAPLAAGSETH